jgi:hypothetical protein
MPVSPYAVALRSGERIAIDVEVARVMKAASGPAGKAMAAAISSGLP